LHTEEEYQRRLRGVQDSLSTELFSLVEVSEDKLEGGALYFPINPATALEKGILYLLKSFLESSIKQNVVAKRNLARHVDAHSVMYNLQKCIFFTTLLHVGVLSNGNARIAIFIIIRHAL
jgi:hypothetical protein